MIKCIGEKSHIKLNEKPVKPGQTVGLAGSAADHIASQGVYDAIASRSDFEAVAPPKKKKELIDA